MKRLRAQLACLAPVVAGLFALSIGAPRAALFHHEHAGDGRAHVHADDDRALAELLEHGHDHHHDTAHDHAHAAHHHHQAAADPHAAAVASRFALSPGDGSSTGHWHEQSRFHRALIANAPLVAAITLIAAAPPPAPTCSTRVAALDRHARAPPSPFSLS